MNCSSPPQDGTQLSLDEWVFRLGNSNLARVATPLELESAFVLSSEDKQERPPKLSVWAYSLARPDQAVRHLPALGQLSVLPLLVGDIAKILSGDPDSQKLKTFWDHHAELDRALPGWCAHAGIAGMDGGSKLQRKDIRSALCDLANARTPLEVVAKTIDS